MVTFADPRLNKAYRNLPKYVYLLCEACVRHILYIGRYLAVHFELGIITGRYLPLVYGSIIVTMEVSNSAPEDAGTAKNERRNAQKHPGTATL